MTTSYISATNILLSTSNFIPPCIYSYRLNLQFMHFTANLPPGKILHFKYCHQSCSRGAFQIPYSHKTNSNLLHILLCLLTTPLLMVLTHCYQLWISPKKSHDNYFSSINNIFCQTIYLPYTASTDDDASAEENIRIINTLYLDWKK
jgi:hypothetical protein